MKKNKGIALIEVIIGATIMSVGILAINETFTSYIQYALANQKNVEASYLLQEGLEAMSFIRDRGWAGNFSNLSTTTTYYLTFSNSTWATTTTNQYVDGLFERKVDILDVKRDGTDKIASAGTYDPNIKQVAVTVSYWQGHGTTTRSISEYLVNIR